MIELLKHTLYKADIGVIIIDKSQRVKFWNKYIEKLSGISMSAATDKKLPELCSTFATSMMQDIFSDSFEHNLCRFCSSKLHKAFIYNDSLPHTRENKQNVKIEPLISGNAQYIIIQIEDITDRVKSELTLTSLIGELKKGYNLVKEAEEYNRLIAFTDTLTGLLNRHAILKKIDDLFANFEQVCEYALLFVDIDGFKSVNDTYGHLAGDDLLVEFSKKLLKTVRHDDCVARLGGDEFLILLKSIHSIADMRAVCMKLLNEFKTPIMIEDNEVSISASIGVAKFDCTVNSASEIIRRADTAMYQAKKNGKDTYVFFDE